jgi:hypothetical protein
VEVILNKVVRLFVVQVVRVLPALVMALIVPMDAEDGVQELNIVALQVVVVQRVLV